MHIVERQLQTLLVCAPTCRMSCRISEAVPSVSVISKVTGGWKPERYATMLINLSQIFIFFLQTHQIVCPLHILNRFFIKVSDADD